MSKEAMKLALDALDEFCELGAIIRPLEVRDALREALAEQKSGIKQVIELYDSPHQPSQQEPVAFYVYKPTLPRGNLGNVSDGDLPWVYDQDPSSGYSARMLVYTTPPQRTWVGLTDEEIKQAGVAVPFDGKPDWSLRFARAIEAAHGIKVDA